MTKLTEDHVEQATLDWFRQLGYTSVYGPDIEPDSPARERSDYHEVILSQRLKDALAQLNPQVPAEALDEAYRKLLHPESPSLVANNRAFHRMLVDGVNVEYHADGRIVGDQVRLIDFDHIDANDWLVVNQSTEGRSIRRQV